jgi:hypothetical protein
VIVRASFITVLLALSASSVAAQTDPPLHRLQLAAGIGFVSGASLGDADADLRSSTSSDPYRVFATSSRLAGATILDLRAGLDLTTRFGVEAHALYGHPELRTNVTGDVEDAPSVTATERLDHYVIDGGIVVKFDEFRVGGWQPFAVGGAGYLRQLHEGLTVTEEGLVFYVGGGARRTLFTRPSGLLRALGARVDVRLNVLSDGITIEDTSRTHLSTSVSLFVSF